MPKRLSYNCALLIKNALIMDVKAYKRNNGLSVLNVTKHVFYCVVKSAGAAITLDTTCLVSCLHHDQKVSYIAQTGIVLFRATRSKNNSGNVLAFKHFNNKVELLNVWNLRHGCITFVVNVCGECGHYIGALIKLRIKNDNRTKKGVILPNLYNVAKTLSIFDLVRVLVSCPNCI